MSKSELAAPHEVSSQAKNDYPFAELAAAHFLTESGAVARPLA